MISVHRVASDVEESVFENFSRATVQSLVDLGILRRYHEDTLVDRNQVVHVIYYAKADR